MTAGVVVSRAEGELKIMRALNRRVRSGREFTVDEIWPRLDGVVPGDYKSWLGNQVARMSEAGAIVAVGVRKTPMSGPKARWVNVWQGSAAVDGIAA